MASRRRKRLSAWGILARLGHTGDNHDDIIQHVFEMTSRVTVRSDDGAPIDGDDFLVETFESLGTTKDWPHCGSPEWSRLRLRALTIVVNRLGREGLLDCVSVGVEGTPASSDTEAGKPTDTQGGGRSDATDARDGVDEVPGVEVAGAMLRRGRRNRKGWSRCVRRETPLSVILRWASACCPDVPRERLIELARLLRGTAWVDEDGHVRGGMMLAALESELEADWRDEEWVEKVVNDEQWVDVVVDFETAIEQLRSVFTRLSLL